MSDRLAEIKVNREQVYTDDEVQGAADICLDLDWLIAEIERLNVEVESLQPQHHYMTKMGAELQEEVSRLHEENKRLKAFVQTDAVMWNKRVAEAEAEVERLKAELSAVTGGGWRKAKRIAIAEGMERAAKIAMEFHNDWVLDCCCGSTIADDIRAEAKSTT